MFKLNMDLRRCIVNYLFNNLTDALCLVTCYTLHVHVGVLLVRDHTSISEYCLA